MQWMDRHGVRYLQFPALAAPPGLWHGIFTRWAYSEDGHRVSLNVGLNNGDPTGSITANRQRLMDTAGAHTAVFARQVHGNGVAVWTGDRTDAEAANPVALEGDALITDRPGSALVIQTADCQSVLLADLRRRVVANVHAGWRGSLANIVGHTVATMTARFQCRPDDLVCGVGPSLGPCCAEFIHYRREIPERYWSYRLPGDHFDFWRLTTDQLAEAGVPRSRVTVGSICTRCNPGLFFSHRGEGPGTGRFASVICLMES